MKTNHSHGSSDQEESTGTVPHCGSLGSMALTIAMRCLVWSALAVLPMAHAQNAGSQAAMTTSRNLSLSAQPLGQALNALARTWGVSVSVDAALVEGRTAPALQGVQTLNEALAKSLAGSGLEAVSMGAVVQIRPKAQAAVTLGEVTVTAQGELNPMTEGTGSYTTRQISIGKTELSIRETPQSVSVITRQQMDDKNLHSLDEVLAQATGVTKTQRNFGDHKFAIRGFVLDNDNYLVDGVPGTVYSSVGWLPLDTAIYDRVEVLRGAAGLQVGAADPSGAVNLVRKRPRTERHLELALSAGSWGNLRTEVDAGGPLNQEGSVRGRVVAAYQDRGYFYDVSRSRAPMLYGVVEADLGRDTTLAIGARRQEKAIDGFWLFGLPRYSDGGALDLSRTTSLVQNWNRQKGSVTELFSDVEHRLQGDWRVKLSLNRTEGQLDQKAAIARGAVDRYTGIGSRFYTLYFKDTHIVSHGLDVNASGSFEAFGRRHQMLMGANGSRQRVVDQSAGLGDGSAIDISNPDHGAIPEPVRPEWESQGRSRDEKYGIYVSARLQLSDPLHLSLGGRLSWLKYNAFDSLSGQVSGNYRQSRELTPYAGLVYDLNRQWSAYISYADSFQPQSAYLTASGTPLSPAVGANYEAGLKGELHGGRLNVSAAVFGIRKKGLAVPDAAHAGLCPSSLASPDCYRSGGNLRSKGFELEASGELLPGWQVAAGYTFVRSHDDEGKSISAETPRHLLRASTTYRLPGEWSAWTLGGAVAAQSGYSYFADDDTSVRMGEGGRVVLDLRAVYRIDRNWTVSVTVANVADKKYYAMLGQLRRGNYFGEPRSVLLAVRGAF